MCVLWEAVAVLICLLFVIRVKLLLEHLFRYYVLLLGFTQSHILQTVNECNIFLNKKNNDCDRRLIHRV